MDKTEFLGRDVGIRVHRSSVGEATMEFVAKNAHGEFVTVVASPTDPCVVRTAAPSSANLLAGARDGLFTQAPSLGFQTVDLVETGAGARATFRRDDDGATIEEVVNIPKEGSEVRIDLSANLKGNAPALRYFMNSLAFVPNGHALSKGGKPDTTYAPAFRPAADNVIGDHFFRSPAVVAQTGSISAILMPDLDELAKNRPMPTIVDLDAKNGVVDATLMSYGFCDYRLVGHVYYANDASMVHPVDCPLKLGMTLRLSATDEPHTGIRHAADANWQRWGSRYFDRVLPQARTFLGYANECYPAAFAETIGTNKLGWFDVELDGKPCGGVCAGWGYENGWVSWQCWFNNLRSAWGMRYWGQKMGNADWVSKADKMLNLALAAPSVDGACPTTYHSKDKTWQGSLITPRPECYYDLPSIAWKGIWLLRWTEDFADCPRRADVLKVCRDMAGLFVKFQKPNGSIPSWLSKDFHVVPVLEESAQTSLPIWFLTEMIKVDPANAAPWKEAVRKGANYLADDVVDGDYWYDFETFFSCSPKLCFENQHDKMRDPHTLMPPQNTLCMQWTAEALRGAYRLTGEKRYLDQALKALDAMCMYQAVWPVSWLSVAYVYGGFGVQNSDGEYNDARQAQFGATLCDFGAELGRKDYFERGVAATRAALTLINDPYHEALGIYPKPNYPLGLEPENCGHGGTNEQDGRTGFDWGEGSGLTSMAWLDKNYGDAFDNATAGWKCGVNGVVFDSAGKGLASPMPDHAATAVVVTVGKSPITMPVVPIPNVANSVDVVADGPDDPQVSVAVQLGNPIKNARFVLSNGKSIAAAEGRSAGGNVEMVAHISRADLQRPFRFEAQAGEWAIQGGPYFSPVDPTFDFADPAMFGWSIDGDFAQVPTKSRRTEFNAHGKPFVGTCEDGRGAYDDTYTGTIVSPSFIVTEPKIKLLVGGGSLPGVYVELIDEKGGQIYVERGRDRERMDERTWDLSKLQGKRLRIRIVDTEKVGWGHINVGWIRCEK